MAALLLGAALLAFGLGAFPLLEPDEGRYADVARSVERGPERVLLSLNGVSFHDKPPLVPWLVALAFAGLGHGELACRVVPALFGLLGILVASWLARSVDRRAGVAGALVLLGAPLWFAVSKSLTLDVPFAVLLALGHGLLLHGLLAPYWGSRALAGVALGLACLAKSPVALPLVAVSLLGVALWERSRKLGLRLLDPTPWIVALVVAGPWYLEFRARDPEGFHAFVVEEHLARFRGWHEHEHGPHFYFVTALWALGPLALTTALAGWRLPARSVFARGLAVFAGVVFLTFSVSSSKVETYILPAFPALAGLIGASIESALDDTAARKRVRRAVAWCDRLLVLAPIAWVAAGSYAMKDPDEHVWPLAHAMFESAKLSALALILATAASLALRIRTTRAGLNLFLGATGTLLVSALPVLVAASEWKSARPAARLIEKNRRPGEQVVAFMTYPRGLPFYLDEPVTLALTTAELPKATVERERPDLYLANDARIVEVFRERRPLLVLVLPGEREKRLLDLCRRAEAPFRVIDKAGDDLLYEVNAR
ncbi:MAG TPA: glycosyltransferase family 39 protein [Planctomycetota bacterium]|nr:glycosyltransferase family 39 protein [Planctomycetota bacterium]